MGERARTREDMGEGISSVWPPLLQPSFVAVAAPVPAARESQYSAAMVRERGGEGERAGRGKKTFRKRARSGCLHPAYFAGRAQPVF